jgi:hypothetical protein
MFLFLITSNSAMTNLADSLADADLDQSTMVYVSLVKDYLTIITHMLAKHRSKAYGKKLARLQKILLDTVKG